MAITVRSYIDGNDNRGKVVGEYQTEAEARKAAAKALGATSLRGAASWSTETGTVYQLGRHADTDLNPTAEIIFS